MTVKLRYVVSIVAIICNLYIFFELTLLIFETLNAEENLGIPFLPLTLTVHSFIIFSALGFINLNELQRAGYLYAASSVSAVVIISSWIIIPIPHVITGGLVFWVTLFIIIRYLHNLNVIPTLMNFLTIFVAGLFLYIQG